MSLLELSRDAMDRNFGPQTCNLWKEALFQLFRLSGPQGIIFVMMGLRFLYFPLSLLFGILLEN